MKHLTLADEIVVLMLDDESGAISPSCANVSEVAVAGGILMELALLGCIDTDLESLFLTNAAPVGDTLLDSVREEIAAESETHPSTWWIERLAFRDDDLVGRVLGRLVASGILREEERRFLWVFSRRAYPPVSGREEREAKARLMAVLFNDEVPDPRDTLLLGLAHSTGVLDAILTPDELRKAAPRIEAVVALEEISRSVNAVASNLQDALTSVAFAHP